MPKMTRETVMGNIRVNTISQNWGLR